MPKDPEAAERLRAYAEADEARVLELRDRLEPWTGPKPKWADLWGIDPDYCEGKPVDEWLDEQRGEA
jgi:hypothetical protein